MLNKNIASRKGVIFLFSYSLQREKARVSCHSCHSSCHSYSLQRQNTRGMKAPMATKMGSMEELSSSA